MIDEDNYQNISRNLPRWFGFLAEHGVKSGDRILYREIYPHSSDW